ncbi:restriction endonuclease subunit S [Staphylococcus aureus]|nr:restriction endonuclease subunit S [Staphylococcus aureus]NGB58130.1 restriction endonuclease subunit S [Staphylococcus aureus]
MSNTQKKNVPELRFPEFEGEWEEKQLGDLTTKIGSGKTPKGGSENYTNKGIPFLRSQNIRNGKLNLNDLVYISKDIDDEMKNSRTYYGDVLLNITGASIGRTAINSIVEIHANLNQHVCIIRLKKEYYYNFFGQYLLSRKGKRKIFLAQSGGSREGLNFKEIANLKIFTPTIFEEQQKIGKFFSKLDRQIELEEQKLELLQQQKKGYMQKIFSQELRFKDEEGKDYLDWTNERLGEVTTVTMGQSPKSVNYTDNSNDTVLIQGNADIENGLINPRIYTREVTKLIQKDEIILTVRAPVGKLAMAQINACIGRGVCSIKGDKFLYYFLEWFATQNKWIRFSQGSTFESISGNDIRNIHIKIPVEDERTKIIKLLNSLDVLNSKTDLKIQNLKQRKQSLLQKIFV